MKTLSYKLISLIIFLFFTTTVSFAHFGSKGPYGGTVSCSMVYDTTVYIGTKEGGVFFSGNSKLLSWSLKPVGLKSGKITSLAHTGSYVFAGTADSGVYIYTGFVGSDRYWNKINTGLINLKIKSLLAIDSITVLAGTENGGLFKTTNKGTTWVAINNPLLNTATITGLAKAGSRILLTSLNGGVFASDDKGNTWVHFNDANTLTIPGTISLSYNASTDEVLVVNQNGLYKASSASTISIPVYVAAQTALPTSTAIRTISNNGTDWYLATDKGVFTTSASAINWVTANTGLSTLDVNTIVPFQTRLVSGTKQEGIFKTSAATISWTVNNIGYNNLETYSMITSGVALAIAATEKGVFVSTDLGASYKKANTGLTDSLNVTDLTFSGSKLIATTKNAGVFISADTGKTWNTFNGGLTNMFIKKVITSNSNVYIFNSTGEIFKSSGVSNWSMIQTGLPSGINPTSLTFFGSTMILGTYGNGVYTRDEVGSAWMPSSNGLGNLNITSVTSNASKIFAGTDGAGVFASDPASINWATTANTQTAITHTALMGLDAKKIEAMAYNAGYVFASYKGGLLATSDNGTTWIEGGNQFNLPSYSHIYKISFVTTRVFVTSENNVLFSGSLSELPVINGITEALSSNKELKIYPNPNGGNFIIDLKNIKGEIKDIAIYDANGKLVKQISKEAFQQIINVNTSLGRGIYFIKIHTGKETAVQKIIIQ